MGVSVNNKKLKNNLLMIFKELVKGYYAILLVGAICILILIISMLFA